MKNILSNNLKLIEIMIAVGFVFAGAIFRIFPHIPNFAPIAALGLFSAVYFPKKYAILVPLAAMFFSDFLIGFYSLKLMFAVYGCFFLISLIGFWLKKNKKIHTIALASFSSSLIFFFVTNLAVWAFTPWYAKNLSGAVMALAMGLPFLRNTLFGDLFYVGVFFGSYEIVGLLLKKKFFFKTREAASGVSAK